MVKKYTCNDGQRKVGAESGWGWIEWGGNGDIYNTVKTKNKEKIKYIHTRKKLSLPLPSEEFILHIKSPVATIASLILAAL